MSEHRNDASDTSHGIIVKGIGGLYTIMTDSGEAVHAKPRGIFRKKRTVPTVGDRVDFEPSGDPDIPFVITTISPRKNRMLRPPISNLDVLILTFSTKQPVPYLEMLDKLIILCVNNAIQPVIWITKMDLDPEYGEYFRSVYSDAGYEVVCSTHTEPIDPKVLNQYFCGNIVGFAGQSGVGKSTLCNMLTGVSEREVGKISERLNMGKHTTRHVELYPFDGGYLADSPGFTNLDILRTELNTEDIKLGYNELDRIRGKCRFDDCLHIGEKGCAVEEAQMDPGRLERYRSFIREALSKSTENK
ncbi:MAG: ribosome small subunit-dependent GTPase A [Clostridiales bacterium]|nr:ribosome small subunit-dependent GTPase A [Clostridiales bacterium]